jgi:hypothetical protein
MAPKGKPNNGEAEKTGAEEATTGAVRGSETTEAEEKREVQVGDHVVFQDGKTLRAAIVTAHKFQGEMADLVVFQGQGTGHATGHRNVKRGILPGQWWWNEKDLQIAKRILN